MRYARTLLIVRVAGWLLASSVAIPTHAQSVQETYEASEPELLPAVRLEPRPGKRPFNLNGDAKIAFQTVLAAYGIDAQFEPDYQSPPPFRFRTGDMDFTDAVRALETVSNSLIVPLTPTQALVVRDTPQKRNDILPQISQSFPIPERMAAQEAQEAMQAAQQILELKHIAIDAGRRMVTIRDAASKVRAAAALFADLSRLRPQISVEVEFLSVSNSSSLAYGLSLPTSSSIVDFGNVLHNAPGVSGGFATFGGGATLLGLGIGSASAIATLTKGAQRNSFKSEVVSLDGQAATLHVGDRYPIIQNGYYGNTTGTGTVYTPPPTVNFEDLGVSLKITPTAHEGGEVSLEIDASFKVLGSQTVNNIPIISTRHFQGKVRLADGEWAVLAGLKQSSEGTTVTGMPIPGLAQLFSSRNKTRQSDETLILLKPRLTTLPPWEIPTHPVWYGTETRPLSIF